MFKERAVSRQNAFSSRPFQAGLIQTHKTHIRNVPREIGIPMKAAFRCRSPTRWNFSVVGDCRIIHFNTDNENVMTSCCSEECGRNRLIVFAISHVIAKSIHERDSVELKLIRNGLVVETICDVSWRRRSLLVLEGHQAMTNSTT